MRQTTAARGTQAAPRRRIARGWAAGLAGLSMLTLVAALTAQQDPPPPAEEGPAPPPAAPAAEVPPIVEEEAPPQLPATFEPPQAMPEQMTLVKPLATQDELEQMQTELNQAGLANVMRAGVWNAQNQQVIARWAEFRTKLMTLDKLTSEKLMRAAGLRPEMFPAPDEEPMLAVEEDAAPAKPDRKFPKEVELRPFLHIIREETLRDVMNSALSQNNSGEYEKFRRGLAAELTKSAETLLDNNFYVRLNAVILLAQLNELDDNLSKRTTERPYVPAAEPLLRVVGDQEQLPALKVPAVRGLRRILHVGKPRDPQLKNRIALTLISEIGNADAHYWYQMRLAETLAALDLETVNTAGGPKPLIVDTLMKVIVDEERHPCARAAAARALGRTPIAGSVDVGLIAYELTHLGHQLAADYNANPTQSYWKPCFWDLYLAFKPINAEEKQGLLAKLGTRQEITSAYQAILPLAKHVLTQAADAPAPIPRQMLQAASDWLEQNTPSTYRVYPEAEPLRPMMAARPGEEAAGSVVER